MYEKGAQFLTGSAMGGSAIANRSTADSTASSVNTTVCPQARDRNAHRVEIRMGRAIPDVQLVDDIRAATGDLVDVQAGQRKLVVLGRRGSASAEYLRHSTPKAGTASRAQSTAIAGVNDVSVAGGGGYSQQAKYGSIRSALASTPAFGTYTSSKPNAWYVSMCTRSNFSDSS